MKSILLEAVSPILMEVATLFILALVGALVELVRRYTGISIEAKHREALQSALQNGARLLIAGLTRDHAVDYVLRSVPDALKALKVDGRARVDELLGPHIAAVTVLHQQSTNFPRDQPNVRA